MASPKSPAHRPLSSLHADIVRCAEEVKRSLIRVPPASAKIAQDVGLDLYGILCILAGRTSALADLESLFAKYLDRK